MATTPRFNGTALEKIKWINTYIHKVPLCEETEYKFYLSDNFLVVLSSDGGWYLKKYEETADDPEYDETQD